MKTSNKKIIISVFSIFLGLSGFMSLTGFAAAQSCPSMTTVSGTTVNFVGDLTDTGGDSTTLAWFEYGLSNSYGQTSPQKVLNQTGIYCVTVSGLSPCTTYHYRAVAENSAGKTYGENKTFTTSCGAISVDIKANNSDGPITVAHNTAATLSWTSTNANSCSASNGWSGSKGTFGSESTGNLTSSMTYTITCTGPGGSASDSVTVNVNNPIVPTPNFYYPIIYVEKSGANISRGDLDYSYTTYASPGDIVEFVIKVKSSPNTLGVVSGIWVFDRLPSEMTYVGNSTTIDGWPALNGITSGGIEIGILNPGQTKTIKFRARVSQINLNNGESISLANFAAARSAGAKTLAETDALIVISKNKYSSPAVALAPRPTPQPVQNLNSNGEVLGASIIKTGPSGTIIIISALSLIISLFVYRKFRGDRILRPFGFWNEWQLKRNLRRFAKEKEKQFPAA